MPEVFISLDDAANFEGVDYHTLYRRIARNPRQYTTQTRRREEGGKDEVLISVSSLSAKGRRAWRAAQKVEGGEAIVAQRTEGRPWYVDADLNRYIAGHKAAYYEAVELAARVQDFIDYTGPDRTGYAERYALGLGVSPPTLYRYMKTVLEANAWALKLEREDGQSRDYFRALALCRKPREKDTFPTLTAEQQAIIENIWFDRRFSQNKPTVTLLYAAFEEQAAARGWAEYPSVKTVGRYVKYLMELPPAKSALYLSARGDRAWENRMQVKGKRDASTLEVMEYVVADGHTFDVWVEYTAPNGKKKAIRPVLVAWEDMRTRRILGPVLCEHSNTRVVKESFIKMCYEAGTVPKHVHMDNGKDFANRETLGQDRNIRAMEQRAMDAELKGFYLAMGARDWSRSLPYHPWDKPIERAFKTFCLRHSRKFASYTGTLTGSRTEDKVEKDVQRMLERGELLTMEEFYETLTQFLSGWYDTHEHRGLKDAGERWTTPAALWEHAPHYEKATPMREYAAMLLMKPGRAKVNSQGFTRFHTLYTAPELGFYVGKWVNIRWDAGDVSRMYVYDVKSGAKICEAYAAELLEFGDRVSEEALEALHRRKNRNKTLVREFLEERRMPPELRMDAEAAVVGRLDLTIQAARPQKVVSLPMDKEFRGELAASRKKKAEAGDEFLAAKAESALTKLRAMNG